MLTLNINITRNMSVDCLLTIGMGSDMLTLTVPVDCEGSGVRQRRGIVVHKTCFGLLWGLGHERYFLATTH